jgi:SAM-dependent methyltransferase
MRSVLSALGRRTAGYQPDRYWEARSAELISTYDDPSVWRERRWNIASSPEADLVPRLIAEHGIKSVLVVGAGSGRQYAYLQPLGIEVRGFDLSPSLVNECAARYPDVATTVDSVVGCADRQVGADLVLSVTVLQHVPPGDIESAISSLQTLAMRMVVALEFTRFVDPPGYIFAHDYPDLMHGWAQLDRVLVAESERERTECFAWTRPGSPASAP